MNAVGAHREFVSGETLARRLELGRLAENPDLQEEVDLDGTGVTVGLRRYE
jgi:biotin operon repressor